MNSDHLITTLPDLPVRPQTGHKGTFGTVIILGGSPAPTPAPAPGNCGNGATGATPAGNLHEPLFMPGAPALCARAAFRAGAGLVKIMAGEQVLTVALTIEPGATGVLLPADASQVNVLLDRIDPQGSAILAIGPGLGQSNQAARYVAALLNNPRQLVLDADALNLLAAIRTRDEKDRQQASDSKKASRKLNILTPHPGEFARLAAAVKLEVNLDDDAGRAAAATALARAYRAIVVLKGHHSVVSDGTRWYVNNTGNAAMATAGSGDVLTGIIASLAAQNMPPFDAAVLGTYLHGKAGDAWAARHGRTGMLARELADHLPEVMQTCSRTS